MNKVSSAFEGDAAFKRSAIERVDAVWQRGHPAYPGVIFVLSEDDNPGAFSNLFCSAFGVADQDECARRAGLPLGTLKLIGAVLSDCVTRSMSPEGKPTRHVCAVAANGPRDLLDGIAIGADLESVEIRYLVWVLGDLLAKDHPVTSGVTPMTRAALEAVRSLHEEALIGGAPSTAGWSSLRRELMAVSDAANTSADRACATFAESMAWPTPEALEEFPAALSALGMALRDELQNSFLSSEHLRQKQRARTTFESLWRQMQEEPEKYDRAWLAAQAEESPEMMATTTPEWQALSESADRKAAEQLGPRGFEALARLLKEARKS